MSEVLPCWCEKGEWVRCFRTARFGLLQCSACSCYRIDPPPLLADTQSSSFYTEYYSHPKGRLDQNEEKGRRGSRFWRVADQVRSVEQPAQTAVDIGCGEGQLCNELKEAGWRTVVGIDVASSRVARARLRYPELQFFDVPLEQTTLSQKAVDMVVMDNVIEHLPDPVEMLNKVRRYLRPGGKLIVITPNMESGHFRLLGRRWTPELAPHAHIFLFTHAAMCQIMNKSGFTVVAEGSFHLAPYAARVWWNRLASGDLKGTLWRSMQEVGGMYGRLIGAGPMLYAVGTPVSAA